MAAEREADFQGPTNGQRARSLSDLYKIVHHPAFRIGFLDAQLGKPFDHEKIVDRIHAETPKGALLRLGWDGDFFTSNEVALAQFRYEEGRLAVIEFGLSCRAWGHPDYPPRKIIDFINARVATPPSPTVSEQEPPTSSQPP